MKNTSKAGLLIAATVTWGALGVPMAFAGDHGGNHDAWICHPVNGAGETKTGWDLIRPDQASSHIDESKYPDGVYWKHESKDGRHDVYATYVNGVWTCPAAPETSTTTGTPTETETSPATSPTSSSSSSSTSPPETTTTSGTPSTTTSSTTTSSTTTGTPSTTQTTPSTTDTGSTTTSSTTGVPSTTTTTTSTGTQTSSSSTTTTGTVPSSPSSTTSVPPRTFTGGTPFHTPPATQNVPPGSTPPAALPRQLAFTGAAGSQGLIVWGLILVLLGVGATTASLRVIHVERHH